MTGDVIPRTGWALRESKSRTAALYGVRVNEMAAVNSIGTASPPATPRVLILPSAVYRTSVAEIHCARNGNTSSLLVISRPSMTRLLRLLAMTL